MNREQLDEIRARYEGHRGEIHDNEGRRVFCCDGCELAEAVPALLDEIDRLNQKIKSFEEFGSAEALRAVSTPENPRGQLRDRIADRVRGSATALADLPYDVVPYIADAVVDLVVTDALPAGVSMMLVGRPDPDAEDRIASMAERSVVVREVAEGSAEGGTSKGSNGFSKGSGGGPTGEENPA